MIREIINVSLVIFTWVLIGMMAYQHSGLLGVVAVIVGLCGMVIFAYIMS